MAGTASRIALAACATVVATLGLAACGGQKSGSPPASGVRQVFTAMPTGDSGDPAGRDIVAAQEMALEERDGRAGSFRVRLVARPTSDAEGPSPELAAEAARAAARSRECLAFIGGFTSSETAAAAPILNRAGLVQVTPTSTASVLTAVVPGTYRPLPATAPTGTRTLIRIPPSDAVQAKATLAYMQEESARRIVIASDGGVYGEGLARDVAREAAASGIKVVDRVAIGTAGAKAAAARKPQALFVAANTSPATVSFLRSFIRLDPEARLFLPDALSEPSTLQALGDAQPRTYVTTFVLPPSYYGPRGVRFTERFRARFKRAPSPFALYGYEAMTLVLDAIGSLPADAGLATVGERGFVARRVAATTDRAGVIGSYSVTATGDTTTDIYGAFRVEDGRLTRGRAVTVRMTR